MQELAPGLWHWQSTHPGWRDTEPWDPAVSSYAIDHGGRLMLFDPLGLPDELERLAADRDTVIVLTAPWHERDTRDLVQRFGWPVYTPRPETAQELMDKWGITAEQAGDGSPDLKWLKSGEAGEVHWREGGDRIPFGIDTFPGREPQDHVLWVESHRAVVSGDTFVQFGQGLEINPRWLRENRTREMVLADLAPLRSLPVEHVLATHGGPHGPADLERAMA